MGGSQSTDDSRNAASRSALVKTSYYELLGVDRQATDDEIKKAYRRKALELHPDRNYGQVERATALFSEVQSAYEVLSDPQERAWYDSHEDAILRDVDPTSGNDDGARYEQNVGLTTADDITRMIGRFHGGVEFSDAPSGFFGFLRETFDNLASEEHNAARQDGLEPVDYPAFGHKDDRHEDVVKTFYASWSGFSTKKSFSWRDQYSTKGVGDRRTRRIIEKENNRFRGEGIREFNDAVRSLVAFVRKRDPRYKPNTQSEAERQKALREATAAQAARQRAANAAQLEKEIIPEWAKVREPEELEESEEEESDEEQFECVACRKTFKSENQFAAHEKSKKHQKTVYALRRKLEKEGVELDLDNETETSDPTDPTPDEQPQVNGYESDEIIDNQHDVTNNMKNLELDGNLPEVEEDLDTASTEDDNQNNTDMDSFTSDEKTLHESVTTPTSGATAVPELLDAKDLGNNPSEPQKKMGKAAQKRAKKAAQDAALADQAQHKCVLCNATFSSKNKLFDHIKDSGHAAPVPAAKGKGKKAKSK